MATVSDDRGRSDPSCSARELDSDAVRLDLPHWNVHRDPQETGGGKVTVEREGMSNPLRAHDGEARRVDETEVLVGVLTQQPEGPRLGLLADEDPLESARLLEVVEEPHRGAMTADDAQERVGLSDHVVRGDQRTTRQQSLQRPDGAPYHSSSPTCIANQAPVSTKISAALPSAGAAAAPHRRGSDRDRELRETRVLPAADQPEQGFGFRLEPKSRVTARRTGGLDSRFRARRSSAQSSSSQKNGRASCTLDEYATPFVV
jgi:hypothetical protein